MGLITFADGLLRRKRYGDALANSLNCCCDCPCQAQGFEISLTENPNTLEDLDKAVANVIADSVGFENTSGYMLDGILTCYGIDTYQQIQDSMKLYVRYMCCAGKDDTTNHCQNAPPGEEFENGEELIQDQVEAMVNAWIDPTASASDLGSIGCDAPLRQDDINCAFSDPVIGVPAIAYQRPKVLCCEESKSLPPWL